MRSPDYTEIRRDVYSATSHAEKQDPKFCLFSSDRTFPTNESHAIQDCVKSGRTLLRRVTTMTSSALTKPQMQGLLAICDFILLVHSLCPWELQLSISLLWLNQERRHTQISTEIMIP